MLCWTAMALSASCRVGAQPDATRRERFTTSRDIFSYPAVAVAVAVAAAAVSPRRDIRQWPDRPWLTQPTALLAGAVDRCARDRGRRHDTRSHH